MSPRPTLPEAVTARLAATAAATADRQANDPHRRRLLEDAEQERRETAARAAVRDGRPDDARQILNPTQEA